MRIIKSTTKFLSPFLCGGKSNKLRIFITHRSIRTAPGTWMSITWSSNDFYIVLSTNYGQITTVVLQVVLSSTVVARYGLLKLLSTCRSEKDTPVEGIRLNMIAYETYQVKNW